MNTTSGSVYDTVKALREALALSVARGLDFQGQVAALIRERESLISTKREQIDRLTSERDAARGQVEVEDELVCAISDTEAAAKAHDARVRDATLDEVLNGLMKIPTRSELLGGQTYKYIRLEEVDATIRALKGPKP